MMRFNSLPASAPFTHNCWAVARRRTL